MRCPQCRGDRSKVVDKRSSADLSTHRRRRVCLNEACKARWTTVEVNVLREASALKKGLPDEYRRQILASVKADLTRLFTKSIELAFKELDEDATP